MLFTDILFDLEVPYVYLHISKIFLQHTGITYKLNIPLISTMAVLRTSLKKNDLEEHKLVKVDINGNSIVLTNIGGKFYAMDSVCSHEGGPLEEGTLEDHTLTCPWHQGKFDITTAKAFAETDWVTDLKSYPVLVDDKSGEISIDTG